MDINQLKYFISVAQTLNFTEAARRNELTQPSISHHISELEKQVGAKLFIRDKRSVTLTAAGQELLPFAMEIVEKAENSVMRAARLKKCEGHIAISAVTAASVVLSLACRLFHPDILISLWTSALLGREQVIAMNANKYDFIFRCGTWFHPVGNFDYIYPM
jgi:DNA-binding transcriptional LysR family regulator